MPLLLVLVPFLIDALSWIFSAVVMKFVVFSVIYLVITQILPTIITALLPVSSATISGLFAQIPAPVWYFLNVCQVPYGFKLVLTALVANKALKMIPGIG